MINEIILMNGYGLYVWSAFSFTLISFGSLFLLTKFQLLKEQRKFVYKFGLLSTKKVRAAKKQYINKEILLGTLNSKI
jgi:heme exporter protein D